jgi:hypothetical protein
MPEFLAVKLPLTVSSALADHCPLELGERARDLEQQPAHRRGGVDVLLIEVEVDAMMQDRTGRVMTAASRC